MFSVNVFIDRRDFSCFYTVNNPPQPFPESKRTQPWVGNLLIRTFLYYNKHMDIFTQKVESIQERDIDLLLLEELYADTAFLDWMISKLQLPRRVWQPNP